MRRGNNPSDVGRKGISVIGIVHSTVREGYDSKGSSRSVVRVDRRANSERTVRRVLLPEFPTDRLENSAFRTELLTMD